jgi:lysophospholipase L1-like esterase
MVACGDAPTAIPPIPTVSPTITIQSPRTTASAIVDNASLTSGKTSCGDISYYIPPKLDANGKTIGPVYTAIGASDTVGTGSTNPRADSWTVQLDKLLPQNYQFVRLGIGGITLHEANQCLLAKAVASQPALVTDWNVVNDIVRNVSLADYKTDLAYFLQQLTSQTQAKIFIGNVPNLTTLPFVVRILGGKFDLDKLTTDWNNLIAQEVAKYPGRAFVVDLQSDLATFKQHPEWIYNDGLHPTTAGYTQLAQAFYNQILANKGF